MNVFISYSVSDTSLVDTIAKQIQPFANVKYWAKSNQPGEEAWATIFKWIDEADLVLVVVTDKTLARAFSVGQEVGRARKANKKIVPLVASGIANSELGFLAGVTYIPFEAENPAAAMVAIQREVCLQRIENEKSNTTVLVLAGIALFAVLASD